MKLKEVTKGEVHYITTDEDGYNQYTRHSSGYWTLLMGESEEPCYGTEELERLFQEWLNPPVEEKPVAYKLMVSDIKVEDAWQDFPNLSRFEPVIVIPSGSADHGKPMPFLSVKDAFDWAYENLNSDLQKWYVERIKD